MLAAAATGSYEQSRHQGPGDLQDRSDPSNFATSSPGSFAEAGAVVQPLHALLHVCDDGMNSKCRTGWR